MRGDVAGLDSPYPLSTLMPAVFQEDGFTVRFTAALDQVLAPIVSALDCIGAYIDPILAPEDFLEWLSSWFGVALDENWPVQRRRRVVARAVELYRARGTVAGLRVQLELVSGGSVEIADSGGVSWSLTPGSEPPGEDVPRLAVRVTVDDPSAASLGDLDALVRAAKPAHVMHRLEVVGP
jgi:phage tail-like protein